MKDFYSGKFTAGTVGSWINQSFSKQGFVDEDLVYFTHAAEPWACARTACLVHRCGAPAPFTALHVFNDFVSRLDNTEKLNKLKPDDLVVDDVERAAAWQRQCDDMIKHPNHYLTKESTDWCYRHEAYCKVSQDLPDALAQTNDPRIALERLADFQEVFMYQGGTTCVDFAGYGKREGAGGDSSTAYNSFCLHVNLGDPLWVLVEIAGLKDVSYYQFRF